MSATVVPGASLEAVEDVLDSIATVVDVDTWDVSSAAAWIVLVGVCIFFTLLAFGSTDRFGCLPSQLQGLCLLNKRGEDAKTVDYFLSARNSAGTWSIALSFFASGMGAWVVYGTTEMGANPALSWLGVLGYSAASSFPAIVVCFLGPYIKEISGDDAFSTSDFGRKRYGRVMQLTIAVISIFYMFIYMVTELTAISNIFALLTGDNRKIFTIGVTVVIGIFTLFYTGFAGLPASIVTDRVQGAMMGFLVIILSIAVSAFPENTVTKAEFKLASSWTNQGFMALVTLSIAILSAELFNQATWQRVWAAESVPAMRKGFVLGSLMVFLLMMFFGIMGMIAYAKDPVSYDTFAKFSYLSFFDLLLPLGNGWHIVVLVFITALCASSLDSLQNGMNSIFYRDALALGYNAHATASILVVLMNVPAIYLASKQYYILDLFLVADLVCATAVLPTFLGLQESDKLGGLLPAPTEWGAFLGVLSGIATVLINGAINDAKGFKYFFLKNGAICSLCGSETMITFIITPLVAGFMTYVFTHLDLLISTQIYGKDKARRSIVVFAFDVNSDPDVVSVEALEKDVGDMDADVDDVNAEALEKDGKAPEEKGKLEVLQVASA